MKIQTVPHRRSGFFVLLFWLGKNKPVLFGNRFEPVTGLFDRPFPGA